MSNVRAVAYLVLECKRFPSGLISNCGKVVKVTKNRPDLLSSEQVAIKVTVEVPTVAFNPIDPEITIVVPEELVQHPVVAEAI